MRNQKFSIIGAGTMGRGIAQVAAQAGYQVLVYDSEREIAEYALNSIKKKIEKLVEKGELKKGDATEIMQRIAVAHKFEEMAGSHIIVEAIAEDREEKKKIFNKIDRMCGANCVMASNTSSIPITEIASATQHPENVIGLHFMNPVSLMVGVEIIRGLKTSDNTYKKTIALAEALAKKPVHSSDRAGFVINRIIMPLINEAITVVDQGVSTIEDVDNGAIHCLNHPVGPLALSDLIGNDTTHHILSVLHTELGERFLPSPLLNRMVEAGLYGNKSGEGFYIWENHSPVRVNDIRIRNL